MLNEVGDGGCTGDLADVEDEVVFAEPFAVGLDESRAGAGETGANGFGGLSGEIDLPHPAAGELDQFVPVTGVGELVDDAQDAVVVVLNGAVELLPGFEDEGIEGFDDGRPLVADVALGRVFESGGVCDASLQESAELVEPDGFADIELQEDQHGALKRGVDGGRSRLGHGGTILVRGAAYNKCSESAERALLASVSMWEDTGLEVVDIQDDVAYAARKPTLVQ